MKNNLIVGLTGSIACGKTTVANIFRNLGADVIDADLIGHQVLRDDPVVYKKVVSTFGKGILKDNGEIDRAKLSLIVFNSSDHLRMLNEIVHPPVIDRINDEIKQIISSSKCHIIILEIVLLIETNMTHMVDSIVVVYADEDLQMQRLGQRGLSHEDARKRISSQMSSYEKASFADFIVYNNDSLSNTTRQVNEIWQSLRKAMCKEHT